MEQTQGKIQLSSVDAARQLIYNLNAFTSEDQAVVFTNALITSVNRTPENLYEYWFLIQINNAWNEVSVLTNAELQKRLNSPVTSAQSDSKEEDWKSKPDVDLAISGLGENSRQDEDYSQVPTDATEARMDPELENANDSKPPEKINTGHVQE